LGATAPHTPGQPFIGARIRGFLLPQVLKFLDILHLKKDKEEKEKRKEEVSRHLLEYLFCGCAVARLYLKLGSFLSFTQYLFSSFFTPNGASTSAFSWRWPFCFSS
jgi:hypothetical protein